MFTFFINFINVFYKWIVKHYWIAIEIALYKYCIIIIIIIIIIINIVLGIFSCFFEEL